MRAALLLFALIGSIAHAKVGDPPGLYSMGVIYCGHSNELSALRTTDRNFDCKSYDPTNKRHHLLWKTVLPFKIEPEAYDQNLEPDVQWCRVTNLSLEGQFVVATNCRREKFRVNAKTGKLRR